MPIAADTHLDRLPERGSHDLDLARTIIDEAKIGHVGFVKDDVPYVVPMAIGRRGDALLLHGSVASRLMKSLAAGAACCVTVTHLDGLVLARSAFHSSMNYRSLMVFGQAVEITDSAEKAETLNMLVDHLLPGRSTQLRPSSRKELGATTLLALPLEHFSIKQRSGPPNDAAGDLDAPVWAGVIPLTLAAGAPQDAPELAPGIAPWEPS